MTPDPDRLFTCCIVVGTQQGINGDGVGLTRLMPSLIKGKAGQFWRRMISDPPSRASFQESMRRLYGFTASEAAVATKIFSVLGFADDSTPGPIRRASKLFSWCEALIPKRIANEYFGDALEQMEGHSSAWITVKTVSTLFWVGVAALRELKSAFRTLAG